MPSLISVAVESLTGEWQINLEQRVPRKELYKARIASSKPSLGFFLLLLCSAVIATLGLISNSTAVVIGAMIVAPLMDPILSLAFALAISNNTLAKRSLLTIFLGVLTVVGTAAFLSMLLDVSEVNRDDLPNSPEPDRSRHRHRRGHCRILQHDESGTVELDRRCRHRCGPRASLCVCGIGLSLGQEVVAVFGRGTVAGITNQISEGSFLLFLANLIGITVASLFIFLIQRYGSVAQSWRNLLVWLGLLGLLSIPLSSSLRDFSNKQQLDGQFASFKAGRVRQFELTRKNPYLWQRVRVLYSNVRVVDNEAKVDLVLSAPKGLVTDGVAQELNDRISKRARTDLGLDDIRTTISVIPNQIFKYKETSEPSMTQQDHQRPSVFRWIKTDCGRAKYADLNAKHGLWARGRLIWFV